MLPARLRSETTLPALISSIAQGIRSGERVPRLGIYYPAILLMGLSCRMPAAREILSGGTMSAPTLPERLLLPITTTGFHSTAERRATPSAGLLWEPEIW